MRKISVHPLFALLLAACGAASTGPANEAPSGGVHLVEDPIALAVNAPDRTDADRALDAGRKPLETLQFFGVQPGWRVLDVFAGGGYTTELLARVVGTEGRVFAQNNTFVLDRFARAPLAERLARLNMPQIVPVELALDAPAPAGEAPLDAVIFVLAYHDTVWQGTDRAAMNRAIFDALRPGGIYGIVDHAAAAGHGLQDVQTFHRIEARTVIDEVVAAGFVLEAEGDFLRNAEDTHDWNDAPSAAGERRGMSDRFVLRFRRPE